MCFYADCPICGFINFDVRRPCADPNCDRTWTGALPSEVPHGDCPFPPQNPAPPSAPQTSAPARGRRTSRSNLAPDIPTTVEVGGAPMQVMISSKAQSGSERTLKWPKNREGYNQKQREYRHQHAEREKAARLERYDRDHPEGLAQRQAARARRAGQEPPQVQEQGRQRAPSAGPARRSQDPRTQSGDVEMGGMGRSRSRARPDRESSRFEPRSESRGRSSHRESTGSQPGSRAGSRPRPAAIYIPANPPDVEMRSESRGRSSHRQSSSSNHESRSQSRARPQMIIIPETRRSSSSHGRQSSSSHHESRPSSRQSASGAPNPRSHSQTRRAMPPSSSAMQYAASYRQPAPGPSSYYPPSGAGGSSGYYTSSRAPSSSGGGGYGGYYSTSGAGSSSGYYQSSRHGGGGRRH